ncbi:MAG: radical SAM family heme chaperone HemW [Chloroflexi bacterium]|nr:radical SAM family heme chaperone HemW [Chloroflexota bacterium]
MQHVEAPLSIYLHIPFCSVRCGYCAFNTYTELEQLIPAYVDALCRELEAVADSSPHKDVQTLYFGGGTPSLLTVKQFELLLEQLGDIFPLSDDVEISLEANPDDLKTEYLRELRALGFNRLSIGMQSANADILRLFDRQHDLETVCSVVEAARDAQFDNLNLDVIFGSPGESLADWKHTVAVVLSLAPDHVSMYGLELKGGTDLRHRVDSGELPQPDDDVFADMYEYAADVMKRHGYEQYEISNWCRTGKQCRHNLQYWRNLPYAGVGAGAHGFAGGIRYSTIASPQRYIAALANGLDRPFAFPLTPAVAKHKTVTRAEDLYETIMMGMRMTGEGINRSAFLGRFGEDFVSMFPEQVERLASRELIQLSEDTVRLGDAGRLLSNGIIREFVDRING